MLERLRMQEVEEIIFSVPEGVVIEGTNYRAGEPVMIIHQPGLSQLFFTSKSKVNEDRGFLSTSSQTRSLDFTINNGAVLYSLWSYLYGTVETSTNTSLRKAIWLNPIEDHLELPHIPNTLIVYELLDTGLHKMQHSDYSVVPQNDKVHIIIKNQICEQYFVSYTHEQVDAQITTVKQIQNNIFCTMDILLTAVDIDTDEKYDVCIHCDRVQVLAELIIGINDSGSASFTPIEVHSVPQTDTRQQINKNIAQITVTKHGA